MRVTLLGTNSLCSFLHDLFCMRQDSIGMKDFGVSNPGMHEAFDLCRPVLQTLALESDGPHAGRGPGGGVARWTPSRAVPER